MKVFRIFLLSIFLSTINFNAQQTGKLFGKVSFNNEGVSNVFVYVDRGTQGTSTDLNGDYELTIPAKKKVKILVSAQGFRKIEQEIFVKASENKELNFSLIEDLLGLDEVVVSATRNRVEKYKAPVVVSTIKSRVLTATQSPTLAEGLNFASGVRVETNCQNCGFTQVRLNGLDGGYTQILLNSRPVFTSLIGVYGLEQIPTNTIEKIEVVRSGGSALYGSNAIAGIVNVITKDPILNTWEVGSNFASINGEALDKTLNFNTSIVADDLQSGFTLFGSNRDRESFDANGDGFTELVKLKNTTVGGKAFIKPNERSGVSVNLNAIKEYRRGGNKLDLAPQFTDITEELDHDTFIGGTDYEIYSKDNTNKLKLYTSISTTERESFYGGLGGGITRQDSILANNAFGNTDDLAWVSGIQNTKTFKNNDVLTVGLEYNTTRTEDVILGYNRIIDQKVNALGAYGQYEWDISEKFTALLGARLDNVDVNGNFTIGGIERNSKVNETVLSPRLTFMYNFTDALKLRGGFARGFRAPQAFNEDLHISSVGGEPQFVILSNDLQTEFSDAFTTSLNYTKTIDLLQLNFLVEGFYTTIQNPFTLVSTGAVLSNGSILEEVRNGEGAKVYGVNFEFGISPNQKWQIQLGGTLQKALFNEQQVLFEADGTVPRETNIFVDEFTRTPNLYGYVNTSYVPNKKFNIDVTATYTGSMIVPFVISDSGFLQLNEVNPFFDLNMKVERHFDFSESFMVTLSGGIRNIFNSYQDDFDTGPTRDSDYVYGPNASRTFFVGFKFGKLN